MPLKLDGWNVTALLDTGSAVSILYMEKSDATFGLTGDGRDATKQVELRAADGKTSPAYGHQFKALDLEGLIIQNPWIFIATQKVPWRIPNQINLARNRYTLPPQEGLILGMDKLRRLRFYIAYGEHKVYVTAADAH
jgi:hypothetical protein